MWNRTGRWTGARASEHVSERVHAQVRVHVRMSVNMYMNRCTPMRDIIGRHVGTSFPAKHFLQGRYCVAKTLSAPSPWVMADMPTAPPPPAGWTQPDDYVAVRCQFCLAWSTMPTPFTHSKASSDKFFPLIPWYQGTRDCPKGFICLVCVNAPWRSVFWGCGHSGSVEFSDAGPVLVLPSLVSLLC